MDTVHKEKLYKIPNAMEGRDSVEFEIFGMEGIPQEDLIARSQPDQREVKRMAMDPEYSAIPSAIPVPYPVTFPQLMIQPAYPPPPTHTVPVVNTYSNGFQQPSTAFASPPSQIPLVTSIDTLYPQVQYPPPATLPSETISTTKTSSTSQDKPVRREQKLVYNIDTDDLSIEERRSKLKMYRWIH